MSDSATFNTTGVPYSVLQFMAQKSQESVMNGGTATITGDQAKTLADMAGLTLDAQGNASVTPQGYMQNLGAAITGKPLSPEYAQVEAQAKQVGASASSNPITDFSSWIETHAANFSLIGFGAIIAIAALIYSQRDNITTVVKQVGKVAALAA